MGKRILKYFLSFILLVNSILVFSQPTDLIFSEYLEGASNDKCVEIYNGTGAPINLSGYTIRIFFNGAITSTNITLPNVSLANCDVYVVCNSSSQAALLAIDDMSSVNLTFNGDDAVALFTPGGVMIDLIGNIGCDPGTEWTGVGNGTADEIIRRNPAYCTNEALDDPGTCPWPTFTAANWTAVGSVGDFSDLGSHTSTCASGCGTNTITTGLIVGSPFTVDCTIPASVDVPFVSTGIFMAGNIYTAQLSSATGSFTFPITIGTLSSTLNAGTITASIPAGTASGTQYRIRVISNNPAVTGSDNGVDITVNGIPAGTLIINELSNGASGAQEYQEHLVIGPPCESVSIQNLIFDDNNGDFGAGTGVASGHYRYTNAAQWGCVPSGSLIVIYNDAEPNPLLPADDLDDTSPNDSVYILPITSSLFEVCTSIPNTSGPTSSYVGCTYSAPTTWNPLGMANSGDCAQVRYSDGTYMHGIGYGTATGGPDNIDLTGGTGNNFYLANTVDFDYTNVANFATGTAPTNESPGTGNTPENIAYIMTFRCTILPVELIDFQIIQTASGAQLYWQTSSEFNSDYFTVERAGQDLQFTSIAKTPAAGNSNTILNYNHLDKFPLYGLSYYRIKQTDKNGAVQYSQVKAFYKYETSDNPWYDGIEFHLSACDPGTELLIFDISGKLIQSIKPEDSIYLPNLPESGLYLVQIICNRKAHVFKISITH